MNERKFDGNDIVYDAGAHGVSRVLKFSESVLQTVKSVLLTFMGECFTNPEAGVPWFDGILGQDVTFSDYAQLFLGFKKSPYKMSFAKIPYFMRVCKRFGVEKIRKIR